MPDPALVSEPVPRFIAVPTSPPPFPPLAPCRVRLAVVEVTELPAAFSLKTSDWFGPEASIAALPVRLIARVVVA